MALNIGPWRPPGHQPLPRAPEYKFQQADVASLAQEGIAGIGKAFSAQYDKSRMQRFRDEAAAAYPGSYGARAAGLQAPGGPYGPGNTPYGPAVPAGGIPAAYLTENPTAPGLKPYEAALLNGIAGPESGGKYNIRYTPQGGTTFEGFDKHPGIFEKGPAGPSSAAGRYQFTKTTWDDVMGPNTPFTPENQDIAALRLARRDYNARTGSDLDEDLQREGFSPRIQQVLKPTWAGIGGKNAGRVSESFSKTLGGYQPSDPTTVQLPSQPQGPGARPYSGPSGRTILRDDVPNAPPHAPIREPSEPPPAPVARADQPAPDAQPVALNTQQPRGAFQAEGLNIRPVYTEGQQFGRQATANAQPFSGIVLHHTATKDLDSALNISRGDPNRGGTPYGYHFYVDRDGSIVQGAPLDARTNHTLPGQGGYTNANSVGISLVGNSQDATPEQVQAATRLAQQLQQRFNIAPDRIAGHGQIRGEKQADEGAPVLAALRGGGGSPATAPAGPAGGGGGAGGAPGGFSVEGLQAALAQAPPVLQQMVTALAARVPGGMQAILGQLVGQVGAMQGGGQQAPPGQATGPNPPPASPNAPSQIAAQAPGVVPSTPPAEKQTASGQHQAPLFQTPQLAGAQTAATQADMPAPGAQPVGLQANDAFFVPPPPNSGGPGEVVQVGTGIDKGNVRPPGPPPRPAPTAARPPAASPPQAPLPPPRPPAAAPSPPRQAAAAASFQPTGGDSTYAATEDYRRAVEAGLITPDGRMVGGPPSRLDASAGGPAGPGPGPAAPVAAPPSGGPPAGPVGGGPADQAAPGEGDMRAFVQAAIRSGDPNLMAMARDLVDGRGGKNAQTVTVGNTVYERDPQTGQWAPVIQAGGAGGGDVILNPGDPRRGQVGIPEDGRSWRVSVDEKGQRKIEPISNPDTRESPQFTQETKLADTINANPEYKKFQAGSQTLSVLKSNFEQGSPAGDVAAVFNFMKSLDPTSTVSAGEQATPAQSQGPLAGLWAIYNKAVGSGGMTPEMRRQFYNAAAGTLEGLQPAAQTVVEEQRRRAAAYKLNPDNVHPSWQSRKFERVEKVDKDGNEIFRNRVGGAATGDGDKTEPRRGSIDAPLEVVSEAAGEKLPKGTYYKLRDGRIGISDGPGG